MKKPKKEYKPKLSADFYALFPSIPPEVIDLIILRKCTNLTLRLSKRGHRTYSLYVLINGCGSFKAINKAMLARSIRNDRKSVRKSQKKRYKKIRLTVVSQFV